MIGGKNNHGHKRLHAFYHPRVALNNSTALFDLNKKEQDIILKHMWPVTIALPKYKESYITTLTDKYSTLAETHKYYCDKLESKKAYRYAYIFLSLLVIPII